MLMKSITSYLSSADELPLWPLEVLLDMSLKEKGGSSNQWYLEWLFQDAQ